MLKSFTDIFSDKIRIYYGEDPKNTGSLNFTYVIRKIFGKRNVIAKDLQKIKHFIKPDEANKNFRNEEIYYLLQVVLF